MALTMTLTLPLSSLTRLTPPTLPLASPPSPTTYARGRRFNPVASDDPSLLPMVGDGCA